MIMLKSLYIKYIHIYLGDKEFDRDYIKIRVISASGEVLNATGRTGAADRLTIANKSPFPGRRKGVKSSLQGRQRRLLRISFNPYLSRMPSAFA